MSITRSQQPQLSVWALLIFA